MIAIAKKQQQQQQQQKTQLILEVFFLLKLPVQRWNIFIQVFSHAIFASARQNITLGAFVLQRLPVQDKT